MTREKGPWGIGPLCWPWWKCCIPPCCWREVFCLSVGSEALRLSFLFMTCQETRQINNQQFSVDESGRCRIKPWRRRTGTSDYSIGWQYYCHTNSVETFCGPFSSFFIGSIDNNQQILGQDQPFLQLHLPTFSLRTTTKWDQKYSTTQPYLYPTRSVARHQHLQEGGDWDVGYWCFKKHPKLFLSTRFKRFGGLFFKFDLSLSLNHQWWYCVRWESL